MRGLLSILKSTAGGKLLGWKLGFRKARRECKEGEKSDFREYSIRSISLMAN